MDKQTITGNGGASYTLTHSVANAQEIEVFVNNVRQEPGVAYTVSGTALTMTGNVASTDDFYVIYQGKALQTTVPPDGSVTAAKLDTGAAATNLGSSVNLATIKDSGGSNTAMTIDSTGRIFQPAKPIMSLRGASTFSSSSPFTTDTAANTGGDIGAISNLREVTAWSQTHINQGGMYGNDGRLTAPVAGIYQFTISCSRTYSQNDESRSLWVVHRPAGSSSVETIYYTWTAGDYGWYTHSFTHIMTLAVNDQISVGAYTSYKWHSDVVHAHFSGQLIG